MSITVTAPLVALSLTPGDVGGDLQLPPILTRRRLPCHSTLRQIAITQVNASRDPTRRVNAEVRFVPRFMIAICREVEVSGGGDERNHRRPGHAE
ncbi:hypothetical protein ACFU8Q_39325 [Streptomyces sp. NPDC057543]|uniref:hypothetical protein n=1 Tax=Streptomyces sp. NPDC057543 TaxID=3346163 RepID=UPI0036CC34BA